MKIEIDTKTPEGWQAAWAYACLLPNHEEGRELREKLLQEKPDDRPYR